MPRKAFIHDLQEAIKSDAFAGLTNVQPGDDDGTLSCTLKLDTASDQNIEVQILVSDISSYPKDHDYFIYTTSDDVHPSVTASLEQLQGRLNGLEISDMLIQLGLTFRETSKPRVDDAVIAESDGDENGDEFMNDDDNSDAEMDDDGEEDTQDYFDDEYGWSPNSPRGLETSTDLNVRDKDAEEILLKLSEDLKAAKLAGFRVGYLGNPHSPIVCVSCRISKLGISEEAMQAWQVNERQYLVCLIRFPGKYRGLKQIFQEDERFGKSGIEIRVDLCDSYKPSLASALHFFDQHIRSSDGLKEDDSSNRRKMIRSFISKPLQALFNERFVKILRYRYTFGHAWSGAEQFFNDYQGKSLEHADPTEPKYSEMADLDWNQPLTANIFMADHVVERGEAEASFPLITMQYALRHFVRCTEFCLVCHCKTNDAFEAMKPYVCSKSLCLYQYMSLGFGPSLDWEILSQPYVVDLLVSFTYVSAASGRLKDFPVGLGFLVPSEIFLPSAPLNPLPTQNAVSTDSGLYEAEYDPTSSTVKFPDKTPCRFIRAGDWIVIRVDKRPDIRLHALVRDAYSWPIIKIADPVIVGTPKGGEKTITPVKTGYQAAKISLYDRNFDQLDEKERRGAIITLLDTLPTVEEMKSYLNDTFKDAQPSLSNWKDKISKSALDVLRWVVASNRSCIIQDDPEPILDAGKLRMPRSNANRVAGMAGLMQFRFVQGAPDKEQRFLQSVSDAHERLQPTRPTIFAWHGSGLGNWHGILREGLHFKDTVNGRAYGHGVYMSPQFSTSVGYARSYSYPGNSSTVEYWSKSRLRISTAISLNEVVNAPSEFVSSSPHLVVAQLDWIQTRYLFVNTGFANTNPQLTFGEKVPPGKYYLQDPKYTALGPYETPIVIPVTAFSQQRRAAMEAFFASNMVTEPGATNEPHLPLPTSPVSTRLVSPISKRQKLINWMDKSIMNRKDDRPSSSSSKHSNYNAADQSDESDSDDLAILSKTKPSSSSQGKQPALSAIDSSQNKGKGRVISNTTNTTDFIPGTLDAAQIPLLAAPSYSTPSSTKSLQRDLRTTLRIQDSQPPAELGWYIDASLITTVYQWIVEMHSFDSSLPLAQDLRSAGLQSVLLELRFSHDYPIAPPFVRVIRPRFLGFQQGGGGHVTAGGALCMELLTNSGWSAVSSIESVLLQVRMALSSTDPFPARLAPGQGQGQGQSGSLVGKGSVMDYGVGEAVEAYVRSCRMHGWDVPAGFDQAGWVMQGTLGGQGHPN
ncbi:hypothetical protein FQN57_000395 [Myotisia sp. PD_48]|nr:hypothetical protein FQN57_000395 [Myotisia sp. PD_48]